MLTDAFGHLARHGKGGRCGGGDDAGGIFGVGGAIGLGEFKGGKVTAGFVAGVSAGIKASLIAVKTGKCPSWGSRMNSRQGKGKGRQNSRREAIRVYLEEVPMRLQLE